MPELPEVETIVCDLKPVLVGAVFCGIKTEVRACVLPSVEDFSKAENLKVLDIKRRGKFINIFLEKDLVMTLHLRMSGRLIMQGHDEAALRFERTRIDFDKFSLRFCDVRKFGRVWLNHVSDYEKVTGIARLGAEPLDPGFDFQVFEKIFMKKKGSVKKLLLEQSNIAGIGNIYADEACFYAGIRPEAEIENLSGKKLEKLFESVVSALNQGIRNRGTSISDFADAYGKMGSNQELLYVYGRGGNPCMDCGEKLKKIKLAGRGTVYCEKCQA